MTPGEQRRHMGDAERAFRRRHPTMRFRSHAFGRLERPELRQGDWLIVGSFGEEKATEHIAHLVCVNLVTSERRIVTGWEKAYALKDPDRPVP